MASVIYVNLSQVVKQDLTVALYISALLYVLCHAMTWR